MLSLWNTDVLLCFARTRRTEHVTVTQWKRWVCANDTLTQDNWEKAKNVVHEAIRAASRHVCASLSSRVVCCFIGDSWAFSEATPQLLGCVHEFIVIHSHLWTSASGRKVRVGQIWGTAYVRRTPAR